MDSQLPYKQTWSKISFRSKQGLTLVELLISVGVMLLVVIAAAQVLLSSQFLASYQRHKVQAMYAAQQLLEQKRQTAFSATSSTSTQAVVLDAGTNFSGSAVTTVTNIDANRNQVSVAVSWVEKIFGRDITMREYFATNLTIDPLLN